MSDFFEGLWPHSFIRWLALVLGAMSVLKLIEFGFQFGFGPTFALLLAYYENLIHALVGWWAEPSIELFLADLSAYFGWDLRLHSHWKHVLILISIYFLSHTRNAFRAELPAMGAFLVAWGTVVALASSIAAGVVPLSQSDRSANLLIVAIPIVGNAIHDAGYCAWSAWFNLERSGWAKETSRRFFATTQYYNLMRSVLGIALGLVALHIPAVTQFQSPGLAVLSVLLPLQALWWLRQGALDAKRIRRENESWPHAFWRTGAANVGAAVLGMLLISGVFISANAGLRFYGL